MTICVNISSLSTRLKWSATPFTLGWNLCRYLQKQLSAQVPPQGAASGAPGALIPVEKKGFGNYRRLVLMQMMRRMECCLVTMLQRKHLPPGSSTEFLLMYLLPAALILVLLTFVFSPLFGHRCYLVYWRSTAASFQTGTQVKASQHATRQFSTRTASLWAGDRCSMCYELLNRFRACLGFPWWSVASSNRCRYEEIADEIEEQGDILRYLAVVLCHANLSVAEKTCMHTGCSTIHCTNRSSLQTLFIVLDAAFWICISIFYTQRCGHRAFFKRHTLKEGNLTPFPGEKHWKECEKDTATLLIKTCNFVTLKSNNSES